MPNAVGLFLTEKNGNPGGFGKKLSTALISVDRLKKVEDENRLVDKKRFSNF